VTEVTFIPTDKAPTRASTKVGEFKPSLLLTEDHEFCAGCGEPVAMRMMLEIFEELGIANNIIGVVGHGCYFQFVITVDIDFLQCLHGRAPACATGMKRMRPDTVVFTLQGDGDMVSEGLAEILHTAARGENITCVMLNNGVFGDTGGQMTAASVVGQRTKDTLEGRDPAYHGYPIPLAEIVKQFPGVTYVARGSVDNAGNVARAKKMVRRAFENQIAKGGFSLVEILTMCPTGWFVPTKEGPEYMSETFEGTYPLGVLKDTHLAGTNNAN